LFSSDKEDHNMGQPSEDTRKFEATGVLIGGLMMIVGGLFLLSNGLEQNNEFRRWQAAPPVQEAGELQAIGSGNDVVIVGSIGLENPTSKGLALYTYWEERRDSLEGRYYWAHVSAKDYRPGSFQLSLGNQTITIRSLRAILKKWQERVIRFNVELRGFTLGEKVTVFGTVVSPDAPFEVRASVICGGGSEGCLEALSVGPSFLLKVAPILMLVGGGLIWAGARKLKTLPNELTA
jgi:hypothetical protein